MNSNNITPIKDLKPFEKNIHVNFKVVELISEKEIRKGPNTHKAVVFKVADETGTIQLLVWNENIDKIVIENSFELVNGYINVFQGTPQLTAGRDGTISSSETVFPELNLEKDISAQKVKTERKKPMRRGNQRQGKRDDRPVDDFTYKVNKKLLWAEKR